MSNPPSDPGWFDIEGFRRTPGRLVVVRRVEGPTVVLGSTQSESVIDAVRAETAGVTVARRRSGGGAVVLQPGDPIWIDIWVPAGDPLWSPDVGRAAMWVGRWWSEVIEGLAPVTALVHRGATTRDEWSARVCFAGTGPGEVSVGGRKVVGLAQWRGREGTLVHACAYQEWDALSLLDVLALTDEERARAPEVLARRAVGLADPTLLGPGFETDRVVDALVLRLPAGPEWEIRRD
jgi:lipoate-protein ligase A